MMLFIMILIGAINLAYQTFMFNIIGDLHVKGSILIKKIFMYKELKENPNLVIMGTREADRLLKRYIHSKNTTRYEKLGAAIILGSSYENEKYFNLLKVLPEEIDFASRNYTHKVIKQLGLV